MKRFLLLLGVFLAVFFYGTQLDALRFLELVGGFIVLAAADTCWGFKKSQPGSTKRFYGAALLALACIIWAMVATRLWTNPDRMLVAASAAGYPRLILWSLQRGAHVNGVKDSLPPLMYALNGRRLVSVESLIRSGADVNERDRGGRTALMNAAGRGYTDILQYLCQAGADPNLSSTDGSTALNEAAEFGQTKAAQILLQHGAQVDQRGEAGRTALIDGAPHPDVVQALLNAHAGVNLQSNDGLTALMVAAGRNIPESVGLLLKAGADPTIKDREGRTALDLAKQYDAAKVIPILAR